MGLINQRDRLCVVQISDGRGDAHIIHFPKAEYNCSNLIKLLSDESKVKIFHFGRFDMAIIKYYLKITIKNIYCTKIASKIARTYTDSHGLKDLCRELLSVTLSKQQQTSNWGDNRLSKEQIDYAASDVLYLHNIRDKLNKILVRENRDEIARECFRFLSTRVELDLQGWGDVFAHQS